jgi:hypothetical protein
LATLHGQNH